MGTRIIESESIRVDVKGVHRNLDLYKARELRKFNSQMLGLGNVGERSKQVNALAGVFDLSGFTYFCSQIDPQLSMPGFLSGFLDWLFEEIQRQLVIRRYRQGTRLASGLPFFAKFTGDGVLFLWDAENMGDGELCNLLVSLRNVCTRYSSVFAPSMRKQISDIPKILRCGAARGMVCSVGNGEDYVGPCINIASRLQKLSSLIFCFSKRGIDFQTGMVEATAENYMVKSVLLRNLGREELVVIRKPEFNRLSKREKATFTDP